MQCRRFSLTALIGAAVFVITTLHTASAQPYSDNQHARGHGFSVERQVDSERVDFSYRFQDIDGESQRLRFSISQQELLRRPVVFRPLSESRLLREMAVLQRDYAQRQGWHDSRLRARNGQLSYELLRGDAEDRRKRLREWQNAEQDAYATVLQHNYYRQLRQHSGRQGYTPDHPRIAAESGALLAPLSGAFRQALIDKYGDYTPRQALAYMTRFVQQIPYDDFTDRLASPGAGFITPGRLLYENRGDCDSKVTLLATLMANLFPDIERRIVYLPGHAMFALNIEPTSGDIFVRDEQREFVIADPTGPAELAVGEAGRAYQSHLRSGAITLLAI